MRAVFLPDLSSHHEYLLSGDILHHLVNVIRIEKDEELLLLNGRGLSVKTLVVEASKKILKLTTLSESTTERAFNLDLILGVPKKDALELSLKQAVELGFRKIYLVRSDYSQTKVPETDRIMSLLVSALEQSNSPFLPEVIEADWKSVPWNDYGTVLMLDSQTGNAGKSKLVSKINCLVIGPEGGFSPAELLDLRSRPQVEAILLPTPILRTPTAVATGAGLILQRLMT
ncbi:MAG: RsmE family RNA methyltransferase [Bdellovibrionota bacterium]